MTFDKPLLGFAAYSGTGKTTLLTRLIPLLAQRGLRVGVVKHAHHRFDIDHPGKDSYELRKAGARQMLVASSRRWALITEHDDEREPVLADLLRHLDTDSLDLVLVEGFKHERLPKIELYRSGLQQPLLFPDDETVIAVAGDSELPQPCTLPVLDLNEPGRIADFIQERFFPR